MKFDIASFVQRNTPWDPTMSQFNPRAHPHIQSLYRSSQVDSSPQIFGLIFLLVF